EEWGAEEWEREEVERPGPELSATRSLRALELLLVLSVAFGPALVLSLFDWWRHVPPTRRESVAGFFVTIVRSTAAIALLSYVLFRQGRSLRHLGLTARWSDLPLSYVLLVLSFVPEILAATLASGKGFATALFHPARALAGALGLHPLLMVSLLVSAAEEELIVRAYLMTEVVELTGNAFLAVAASVAFQGLYHLYQGTQGAVILAGWFLICSIYYAIYRRVTPLIVAHFLHNMLLYGYFH